MNRKILSVLICAILALSLTACGAESEISPSPSPVLPDTPSQPAVDDAPAADSAPQTGDTAQLSVRFGSSAPFTLYLEENDTAAAIARRVGTADWRLPIYHYDDYEGWEAFQYYDIPSRYEIPDGSVSVTEEKAGEVYYSEPNRIVLFYHDAEITGEYTLVGHFDVTEEFTSAVENNPTLEGWGNKIISISPGA